MPWVHKSRRLRRGGRHEASRRRHSSIPAAKQRTFAPFRPCRGHERNTNNAKQLCRYYRKVSPFSDERSAQGANWRRPICLCDTACLRPVTSPLREISMAEAGPKTAHGSVVARKRAFCERLCASVGANVPSGEDVSNCEPTPDTPETVR